MQKLSIYAKAKHILVNPSGFFHSVKSERGIKDALIFFFALTFVVLIITSQNYVSNLNIALEYAANIMDLPSVTRIEITPLLYAVIFISILLLSIAISFARYYFIHIFVRVFNKTARYEHTYRALSYSITPGYAGAPFLILSMAMMPLMPNGWAILGLVVFGLIYLAFEVYSIYVRSKGLSMLQNISIGKSILCIYFLGLVALLLAAILLELVVILIASIIL